MGLLDAHSQSAVADQLVVSVILVVLLIAFERVVVRAWVCVLWACNVM